MRRRVNLVDEVRREIIAGIADDTFPIGQLLPNEQEMSDRFGVSRATIREAYRGLIDEGYLTRRVGTGTLVSRLPLRHSLDVNLSYTSLITQAGFTPGAKVISLVVRLADAHEQDRLELTADDEVLAVERVRLAGDRPVVYSLDRIPYSLLPSGDLAGPFSSLYGYLSSLGVYPHNARTKLLPVLGEGEVAKHLRIEPGTPLLFFDETDYDHTGRPVMTSFEWHTSDVFELWINRRARGAAAGAEGG